MASSVYTAGSPEQFRRLSEEHEGLELHAQLTIDELTRSASRWGLRHLLGFRLLTLPEESFLETIKGEHESCGFFWVALARASRTEAVAKQKVLPQRERRAVEREGFVNSTEAIVGSSSPSRLSSSEFEVAIDDVDEDEHETRRNKPEEVTVHLMVCFLQFGLNLCLLQNSTTGLEVQPRVKRRKCTTYVAGIHRISAEDDGGICQVRHYAQGWEMTNASLALLEAKKAFKYMHFDQNSGRLKPVISNATLAHVFLIASTSTFIRFVHFKFGSGYEEYIAAATKEDQRVLVDDETKDIFAYMSSTKWFNLQSPEGRRVALCHILALLRWHVQTAMPVPGPEESMASEDDDDPVLSEDGDSYRSSENDEDPRSSEDSASPMDYSCA
ncbi:hypothetical protein BDW42DRAFT_201838 [Aspergillus taichungensis]|uniref:Uncharacterized protein n=1 Tax=Aspergillus taichungensis TaxID=482145 RepID=A0A2J5HPM1_9EURO|nr:hypothetical protein BDW42DRAFT_201838 [Aspergillus taichungensis]